jgi:ABC-type branched-subunit amino acid transport system substrate-binding protein
MRKLLLRNGDSGSTKRLALLAGFASLALVAAACGGSQPHDLAVGAVSDTEAAANPLAETGAGDVAASTDPAAGGTAAATPGTPADSTGGGATAGAAGPSAGTKASGGPARGGAAANTASNAAGGKPAAQGGAKSPAGGAKGAAGTPIGAAPAPAGGNGGATEIGVTGDSIRFGSISGNNTPLGNLISQPVTTAVFATMRAVNDAGGVHGRKFVISDCDDSGDVTRFRACYRKLIDEAKIFSFITSVTWGTGEVHGDLARDKIPWIGSWGFYTSEWKDPWMFPLHLSTVTEARATAGWVRDILKPKTVGILYLNTPEQQLAKQALHQVLDPAGIKTVREIPQEIDTPDESSNVFSMRAANPDHIIHMSWPPPMIKFIVDSANQGYWPKLGISGNHLIGEQVGRLVGEWPKKGMYSITSYKLWGSGDEYQAIMDKYAPQMKKLHHHQTQEGYIGVKVAAEAMKVNGPKLTRDSIIKTLESRRWDFGPGMGQSVLWAPGNHDTMRCEYMMQYNSPDTGSYKVFIPEPRKSYVCDDGK